MLQEHTETEYHLTPHGWLKGCFWVYGTKTEDVPIPSDRVETCVEKIDDGSGVPSPAISWRRVWESDLATQETKAELRQQFPRQNTGPSKRFKKPRRTDRRQCAALFTDVLQIRRF